MRDNDSKVGGLRRIWGRMPECRPGQFWSIAHQTFPFSFLCTFTAISGIWGANTSLLAKLATERCDATWRYRWRETDAIFWEMLWDTPALRDLGVHTLGAGQGLKGGQGRQSLPKVIKYAHRFTAYWGKYKVSKAGGGRYSLANVLWLWKHKGRYMIYFIVNRNVEHGTSAQYLQWIWYFSRFGGICQNKCSLTPHADCILVAMAGGWKCRWYTK